jgi:hypothetical protein
MREGGLAELGGLSGGGNRSSIRKTDAPHLCTTPSKGGRKASFYDSMIRDYEQTRPLPSKRLQSDSKEEAGAAMDNSEASDTARHISPRIHRHIDC